MSENTIEIISTESAEGVSSANALVSFGGNMVNTAAYAKQFMKILLSKEIENRRKKLALTFALMMVHAASTASMFLRFLAEKFVPGVSLFVSIVDLSLRYNGLTENVDAVREVEEEQRNNDLEIKRLKKELKQHANAGELESDQAKEKITVLGNALNKQQNNETLLERMRKEVKKSEKSVGYGIVYVAAAIMMLIPPLYILGLVFGNTAIFVEKREAIKNGVKYLANKAKIGLINLKNYVKDALAPKPAVVSIIQQSPTVALLGANEDQINAQITSTPARLMKHRAVARSLTTRARSFTANQQSPIYAASSRAAAVVSDATRTRAVSAPVAPVGRTSTTGLFSKSQKVASQAAANRKNDAVTIASPVLSVTSPAA